MTHMMSRDAWVKFFFFFFFYKKEGTLPLAGGKIALKATFRGSERQICEDTTTLPKKKLICFDV